MTAVAIKLFLRKFGPWLLLLAAFVGLLFAVHRQGVEAGERNRDPEVAKLTSQRDGARADAAQLESALAFQNAALADQAAELAAAERRVAAAGEAARRQRKAVEPLRKTLAKADPADPALAEASAKAWEILK